MATLVFDIETVGEEFDALDNTTKSVLTRWLRRAAKSEEEYNAQLADLRNNLGFSPLTGFIVSVGVYDIERDRGTVYYVGEGRSEMEVDAFLFKSRTEAELLAEFWDGARAYDTFVTFNGRAFDVPFLLHRSVAHCIRPTVSLLDRRYLSQQRTVYHIDLQDELTFYGAMSRRPSLHLFCRAYGIETPKAEVSGDEVAELFRQKKFRDIALYNARDVRATAALYQKWREYLAPPSFLNTTIDF